jgi:hypothetical protein
MIVLLKMKNDEVKKAFIRNHIFQVAADDNRKVGQLATNTIKAVFWPDKKGLKELSVDDFLKEAEENDFWNLN